MKAGEILLIVLVLIAAIFIAGCTAEQTTTTQQPAVSARVTATGCAWRPGNELPFGTCEAVVGAYFNGVSCETLSGCPQEAVGKVPFSSMQECITVCQPELDNRETTETTTTTSNVKEFTIEAKQFEFMPSTITVNEGDTVRLIVTSKDVEHGLGIPEFDVSLKVDAGKTETVEFVADKKGTYSMSCNVFCGSGHSNMKGTLIVK